MEALSLYDELTAGRTRFLRVDDLCRLGSEVKPALLPTKSQLEAEARLPLREKQKAELKQGIFLSEILADPEAGTHLCHTMLLPREDSGTHLEQYKRNGALDLGTVHLQRRGKASVLTMRNPRYLNAEDESTIAPMEIAVDVALLDPQTEVCVLRGGAAEGHSPDLSSTERLGIDPLRAFPIGGHGQPLPTRHSAIAADNASLP